MKKSIVTAIAVSALSLVSAHAVAKESVPKKKLNPIVHVCKKTDRSIDALACNIYKEGRGEPTKGQYSVAFVTINRIDHEKFPTSVRKVVYQHKQFSWANSGKNTKIRDAEAWGRAQQISQVVYALRNYKILYNYVDPTKGAVYYHATGINPYWAKSFEKTVTIGNHVFYKMKEVR